MARLSMYLPPFAGDYSGACSVLFGLDCLVVILDAGCCTRNYVEYDEPRWTRRRKPAFSAQIRTLDTVMGDEAGIVAQVVEAADRIRPACIALVGTPVPAIVGMDVKGLACDVENACGIPAIGIPTNGFETYERGMSAAYRELIRRFARIPGTGSNGACKSVNVLGITPFDYPNGNDVEKMIGWLNDEGLQIAFTGIDDFDSKRIERISQADANIVASWGGLAAARLLRKRFGIPYVVGSPLSQASAKRLARELGEACPASAAAESKPSSVRAGVMGKKTPRLLLVGDQVVMGSLREEILRCEDLLAVRDGIAVASFFSMDADLSEAGDFPIAEDVDLARFAKSNPETMIVGDPLLARIPAIGPNRLVPLVHKAVSSTLFDSDRLAEEQNTTEKILHEIRVRVRA